MTPPAHSGFGHGGVVKNFELYCEIRSAKKGFRKQLSMNVHRSFLFLGSLLVSATGMWGQTASTYYKIDTVAGNYPLGDNGPAARALLFGPKGVAVDRAGNVYVADERNSRVRKITPQGAITTLARIRCKDVAVDPAGENVYVLSPEFEGDLTAPRIYRIDSLGIVQDFAGNGQFAFGGDGGDARRASIQASAIVFENGTLYIADEDNHRIRRVVQDGTIQTVAGDGVGGFAGDAGPATAARLRWPGGIAVRSGVVYIADTYNHRIRRINADGTIATIAGTGVAGLAGDGGPATLAQFAYPQNLAIDPAGNLLVSSSAENRIRRITPSGTVQPFAGTGNFGFSGDGAAAAAATFNATHGIAVDANNILYVADSTNDRIRRVDAQGTITTFAGASHFSGDGGPAPAAVMKYPSGVAVDGSGNIYISDSDNHRIRVVNPQGTIQTFAGNGVPGLADGPRASAAVAYPYGMTFDISGSLYFADWGTDRVRRITSDGVVGTVAGNGSNGFSGDGSPANTARLNGPTELAFDAARNLYIADSSNHRIRKVTPDGAISTFAGSGLSGFAGDGGLATTARLRSPMAVTVDREGNVYIADTFNNRIRRVAANGLITTFAGNGQCCSSGDNGPAANARLGFPFGLAFDANGNLFVADMIGNQIRRIAPNGTITTVAGSGERGISGDGGLALLAQLDGPGNLAVARDGTIYFTDLFNHRVRKLTPLIASALTVASGDRQIGVAGKALPTALTVKVATADGIGVPGVTVTFSVVSGAASISPQTVVSGVDGTAGTTLTFADSTGQVEVRAVAGNLQAVRFTATAEPVTPAAPAEPRIAAGGVISGGQSTPPLRVLAPGSQAWISGESFAGAGAAQELTLADLTAATLPLTLGGVCVSMGGVPAPIFSVAPGRIGVITPDVAGEIPVQVTSACGTENELKSNVETVTVRAVSPEFYYKGTGDASRTVLLRNEARTAVDAAAPGDVVWLRLTGLGAVTPALAPGSVPSEALPLVEPVKLYLNGAELAAEDLLFAGASPDFPGLYDLKIRLSPSLAAGDLPIQLLVGGASTAENAVVKVVRPSSSSALRSSPKSESGHARKQQPE